MAYEILNETAVEERTIAGYTKRPRFRRVLNVTLDPGDVIKLDGYKNAQKVELCQYTIDAAIPSGTQIQAVVTLDMVQVNTE